MKFSERHSHRVDSSGRKTRTRKKIVPSRISTEKNSSKSSTYKHKPLPTTLKTCDILAPAINLFLPPFDNDPKEEDIDSLVKMLSRSLQPDNDVLCAEVELTLFRNHKVDTETIAEAARLAMKFEKLTCIFPLTNRCYRLILTASITSASSERSFSKLKVIKTVMRSVMN